MRFPVITAVLMFIVCIPVFASPPETSTFKSVGPSGDTEVHNTSIYSGRTEEAIGVYIPPMPDSSEIWHYSVASGLQQKNVAIGYNAGYVFNGGWYGGGKMFTGIGGSGTPDWETPEPSVGTNEYWKNWEAGTAASETTDIFYGIFNWEIWNNNGTPGDYTDDYLVSEDTEVNLYNHSSATPVWTYVGTGSFKGAGADGPGHHACSDDGATLAVSGSIDGHLAIQFFHDTSGIPFQTYENASIVYTPRQLRLTADGSKCLFRTGATLYRVDVATGVLEDDYNLSASTDCFGVSADGSVVAYGFTQARVATWDGSSYSQEWSMPVSGYYGGAAAVADDNSTIYFGFYKNNYLSNRIYRHDISSSTPEWTYDYPTGSGGYQDIVEWMDCSADGRWLVVGSWGCQNGGGPEIEVFDDNNPSSPNFTIDSPGSIFHVDITPDGQYIAASGKHVHANVMGSGADVYFAEIEEGSSEENDNGDPNEPHAFALYPAYPNPARDAVTIGFALPQTSPVNLDVFDIKGRKVETAIYETLSTGEHEISIATGDLAGGVYLYRLSAGGDSAVKKMVVK